MSRNREAVSKLAPAQENAENLDEKELCALKPVYEEKRGSGRNWKKN